MSTTKPAARATAAQSSPLRTASGKAWASARTRPARAPHSASQSRHRGRAGGAGSGVLRARGRFPCVVRPPPVEVGGPVGAGVGPGGGGLAGGMGGEMGWTVADLPPLRGRTAVVTGPGGLGFETALALARAGAEVV